LEIISIHLSVSVDELHEDMSFYELGMDSLTLMKIIMAVENIFDVHIDDDEIVDLRLISDIAEVCVKKISG
jgi:acyl carrier protein